VSYVTILLGAAVLVHGAQARERDPFIARVIVVGLVAKLAGSTARYWLTVGLYGFSGDSGRYRDRGAVIAAGLREGRLPEEPFATGAAFIDNVTGLLFALTQPSMLIAFTTFALLSYFGAYLFLRAFTIGFPSGDRRRYAVLVMFLPTLVYWPTSLGKEAWISFALGLGSYGAARVYAGMNGGYALALLGGAAVFQVRPHMGALFAVSVALGFLLRWRSQSGRGGPAAWLIGVVIIGSGTGYALANFGELLPRDELIEGTAVDQVFSETERRTSTGGSEFQPRPVDSIVDLPAAMLTVPFRPFPNEVHNTQSMVASIEGLFLLLLILLSLPRLRSLLPSLARTPYVTYATAFTLGFIVAFSNIGNFGILTRQRAQLLPLLVVLLALPHASASRRRPGDNPRSRSESRPAVHRSVGSNREVFRARARTTADGSSINPDAGNHPRE
jgi:hypothetical protein